MKKAISIIIAAVIVISALTGCTAGSKLTAYELYSKAVNDIREAGGYEVNSIMTTTYEGELFADANTTMELNTRQAGNISSVSVGYDGETVTTTILGEDVFIDTPESKMRYKLTSGQKPADVAPERNAIPEIGEDLFEGVEVIKNDDGSKTFTITASGDHINSFTNNQSLADLLASDIGDMSIENIEVIFVFDKKDTIVSIEITEKIVVSYSFISINSTLHNIYTFVNVGTAPKIETPNPDDYEQVDSFLEVE